MRGSVRNGRSEPRVVITGVGVVAANGVGVDAFHRGLSEGRCGVGHISLFDPSLLTCHIAAEVDDLPAVPASIGPYAVEGRPLVMAVSAAREALAMAGMASHPAPRHRRAVVFSGGCTDRLISLMGEAVLSVAAPTEELSAVGADRAIDGLLGSRATWMMPTHTEVVHAPALALMAGAGQVLTLSTACAGGAQALADAASLIARGEADVALAGGSDSLITRQMIAGFCKLTALSTRNDDPQAASRPFEANRDGFVMGEGAGMVVLESEESARRRGAPILAVLGGVGLSCDAWRLTDPHPEGDGMALAMERALAGFDRSLMLSVNAHGTSTKANDRTETLALKRVLGDDARRAAVSGTKSMTGHLIHGAGAIEAVAAVLSLREQVLYPTLNFEEADPELDLDYVPNDARQSRVDAVLSNSFGFGGQNTSLLFSRFTG